MKPKSIKIGKFTTENNLFFAPLAGFSDFAMRSICISYGAGLTFTEMVSCKGLLFDNENTKSLLHCSPNEKIKCVQIFGNDPEIMRRALESEQLAPFDVADINFGCPMPKIFNNGEGSALMEKPALAEKIVSECKKSGKAVTCKIRTGIKDANPLAVDFAKATEQGGADMITVHGRSRERIYAGEVNFDVISKVKQSVNVPVIANGGIFTPADADELLSKTGADGVMIARGALEKPWIFSEILHRPFATDKAELICRHINMLLQEYDDKRVAVSFRKQLCLYLKGEKNSTDFKQRALKITSTDELKESVREFFAARQADGSA